MSRHYTSLPSVNANNKYRSYRSYRSNKCHIMINTNVTIICFDSRKITPYRQIVRDWCSQYKYGAFHVPLAFLNIVSYKCRDIINCVLCSSMKYAYMNYVSCSHMDIQL